MGCDDRLGTCSFGDFYLDITATPASPEIHIAGRIGKVCVPDDLLAQWRNPPPGSKMEAFQNQLKASLRARATLRGFDQTKWMTVDSDIYSIWNPSGRFPRVVTATDGGSCAVGHHEVLALSP